MADLTMVDSAFPPQQHAADICLVYCGGDTPHTWSKGEALTQGARYRLPTWVRSNPFQVSASTDIAGFTAWLRAAGVPRGSTVCLDLETAIDTAYVNAFNSALTASGYPVMKYGSKGFIFGNPETSGGTFVADPTGEPHMVDIGDTVATQYLFTGAYDLSLVKSSVRLWDVRGGPAPAPKPDPAPDPKPAPAPAPEDDDMVELDTNIASHPLLLPYGTKTMDLLSVAPEGAPLVVEVTFLGQGSLAGSCSLSWGTADTVGSGIEVPQGVKKARIDVSSGGGLPLSVRFNS